MRAAYKAVQRPRDLEKELPQCGLGALLLQWLKQVGLARKYIANVHLRARCCMFRHGRRLTNEQCGTLLVVRLQSLTAKNEHGAAGCHLCTALNIQVVTASQWLWYRSSRKVRHNTAFSLLPHSADSPHTVRHSLPTCINPTTLLQTEPLLAHVLLLQQVRCVARKAAALREANAALAGAREALGKKEQQLEEAKEAKVRPAGLYEWYNAGVILCVAQNRIQCQGPS